VWRDLAALQEAGFPLIDEKRDRKTVWKVMHLPLKALTDAGLSVTEVCSLYVSRELLLRLTGTVFEAGLNSLLKKVQKALSPQTRKFLDELPNVVRVRGEALKKVPAGYDEMVARLIAASTRRRVSRMRYFSVSSNRQKDYVVHPYRVEYSDGGLYLVAFVPEYDEMRFFAVERIKGFTATDEGFTPVEAAVESEFEPSLGMGMGKTERIQLEFSPRVAPYVRERVWHTSQRLEDAADGGVRLTLKVCRDWALHGWVLSWGPHVRVVAPSVLAEEILAMLDGARERYVPKLNLPPALMPSAVSGAPFLPGLANTPRRATRSGGSSSPRATSPRRTPSRRGAADR
jgi:predicted DNA-binding transcriptional regulator YafY